MIERPYTTADGAYNGHLIMTEAAVSIETPKGKREHPAGTMFHVQASPQKLPVGATIEGEIASEEAGYGNVLVHWAKSSELAKTHENEASLRRKIAEAEYRRWLLRSSLIGATGGSALALVNLVFTLLGWLQ